MYSLSTNVPSRAMSVEHLQVLRGMFGFFEPGGMLRSFEPGGMLRSFAARGIYCLKLV